LDSSELVSSSEIHSVKFALHEDLNWQLPDFGVIKETDLCRIQTFPAKKQPDLFVDPKFSREKTRIC
jgi:hypothetical protein